MSSFSKRTGAVLVARNIIARLVVFGGGYTPVSEVGERSTIHGNVIGLILGNAFGNAR